ncbi:MAG: 2Fe-2S iron-sulfur cluster-binding protein [Polymorphobacter sp.]
MTRITYLKPDGSRFDIDVEPGINLMEAALANNVAGIDGDCGGNAACATCHVHVAPEWRARVGAANDAEAAMLEFAEGVDASSRLACQLVAANDLDGLVLHLPAAQH